MRSAQVAGQWRGDTALTLPLFWWRSTVSAVFFGWYPRSSLHSFVPSPPPSPHVPVPNKPPHFCGREAKWPSTKVDCYVFYRSTLQRVLQTSTAMCSTEQVCTAVLCRGNISDCKVLYRSRLQSVVQKCTAKCSTEIDCKMLYKGSLQSVLPVRDESADEGADQSAQL